MITISNFWRTWWWRTIKPKAEANHSHPHDGQQPTDGQKYLVYESVMRKTNAMSMVKCLFSNQEEQRPRDHSHTEIPFPLTGTPKVREADLSPAVSLMLTLERT
jgi:hypothetical protein